MSVSLPQLKYVPRVATADVTSSLEGNVYIMKWAAAVYTKLSHVVGESSDDNISLASSVIDPTLTDLYEESPDSDIGNIVKGKVCHKNLEKQDIYN